MLPNFVKVLFLRSTLKKLRDVDHGTTAAGTVASVLLASSIIDLDKLVGGTPAEIAVEAGKATGILIFWLIMKAIGKPLSAAELIKAAEEPSKE